MTIVTKGIINMPFDLAMGDELTRRQFHQTVQARIVELEALVERAFKDGVAYGTNVAVEDVELAWLQSKVKAELEG